MSRCTAAASGAAGAAGGSASCGCAGGAAGCACVPGDRRLGAVLVVAAAALKGSRRPCLEEFSTTEFVFVSSATPRILEIYGSEAPAEPVTEPGLSGWGFSNVPGSFMPFAGARKINWHTLYPLTSTSPLLRPARGLDVVYPTCPQPADAPPTAVADVDNYWWLFRYNGTTGNIDGQIWLNLFTQADTHPTGPNQRTPFPDGFYSTRVNYIPDTSAWTDGGFILLYISSTGAPPAEEVWTRTLPESVAASSVLVQNAAGEGQTITSPLGSYTGGVIDNGPGVNGLPARPVDPSELLLAGSLSTNSVASPAGEVDITTVGTGCSISGASFVAKTVA